MRFGTVVAVVLAGLPFVVPPSATAALFRRPTKVFQDAVAAGGDGLRVLRLTGTIPNEGGVPIVGEGRIVGVNTAQRGRVI
jgi:hypothetical protein